MFDPLTPPGQGSELNHMTAQKPGEYSTALSPGGRRLENQGALAISPHFLLTSSSLVPPPRPRLSLHGVSS